MNVTAPFVWKMRGARVIPFCVRIIPTNTLDTPIKRTALQELEMIAAELTELPQVRPAERIESPTLSLGSLEIVVGITALATALPLVDALAKRLGSTPPSSLISRLLTEQKLKVEVQIGKDRIVIEETNRNHVRAQLTSFVRHLLPKDDDKK